MTLKTVRIPWWDVRLSVGGLMSVVGATLILISISPEYSYGNLNPYVMSYLRWKDKLNDVPADERYSYSDWIYIAQGKVLVAAFLSPVGGVISSKLGFRLSLIIGCVIASGGYYLTYFALDAGIWACVFSIAVSGGIGFALIYPPAVATVLKWFPESQRGLFGSVAVAGMGFGSAIWTPLETGYANPNNLNLSFVGDDEGYFVEKEVLDNVPEMFVLLAICFTVLQIPALLLLREPTAKQREEVEKLETKKDIIDKSKGVDQYSVKPRDVVKLFNFWKIYSLYFTVTITNVFINNYNKVFGQQFIKDDQFFSMIGTLTNMFNGTSRLVWGAIYDRMGFQFCMVVISSVATMVVLSFSSLALITDPDWAKIFYGVMVVGLYAFLPGSFSSYPPAINTAFGPKYCSVNYGLVISSGIFYSLVLILVIEFLEKPGLIGYPGIFLMCGVFGIFGMVMALLYPREISSEIYRGRFKDSKAAEKIVEITTIVDAGTVHKQEELDRPVDEVVESVVKDKEENEEGKERTETLDEPN